MIKLIKQLLHSWFQTSKKKIITQHKIEYKLYHLIKFHFTDTKKTQKNMIKE